MPRVPRSFYKGIVPSRRTPRGTQIPIGEMVWILFDVDPPVGGITGETLWGERVAERRYRLRSIPCAVFGVSEHDIVFADDVRGILHFQGVSLRGGHSTYRIQKARGLDPAVFRRHWEPLKELGCSYEGDGARLMAIDVPPHIDIGAVHELLFAGADAGAWEFEEAHRP